MQHRNFCLLFAGQATSFVGDGMVPVAVAFAVLGLTGSVADVGLVFAARLAPLACFLIIGGVIADRLSRRTVVIVADLIRCGSQGLLAALLLSGHAHLWQLLVLQAVHGVASAFFNPAVSGLAPEMVAPDQLQQANALRWGANSLGNVAGPALAGVLVATIGAGAAFAVDAATFAASAASLLALRPLLAEKAQPQTLVQDLRAGWTEFRSRTWLVTANIVAALGNALVLAPFLVIGPAVCRTSLSGAGAWALISASFGAGAVAGGIVALRVRPRRPILIGLSLTALHAGPLALLALRAPAIVIAIASFAAGSQLTFLNVLWETTLQRLIPPHLLSRVVAYDWVSALVFAPIGYAVAGALAGGALGVNRTLWMAAGVAVLLAAVVPLVGDVRRLELPEAQPSSVPPVNASPTDPALARPEEEPRPAHA